MRDHGGVHVVGLDVVYGVDGNDDVELPYPRHELVQILAARASRPCCGALLRGAAHEHSLPNAVERDVEAVLGEGLRQVVRRVRVERRQRELVERRDEYHQRPHAAIA